MATLGDMITRIHTELHQNSITAVVQNAVLSAVAHYKQTRFYFNETTWTFTVSTTSSYAIDTVLPGMAQLDTLKVWYSGNPYRLTRRPWSWIDEVDLSGTVTGAPYDYAIHHKALRLYPVPDATYTAVAAGVQDVTLTASLSASAVWTNEAEELIRFRAMADLSEVYTREPQMSPLFRGREMQALQKLLSESTQYTGVGRMRPYL